MHSPEITPPAATDRRAPFWIATLLFFIGLLIVLGSGGSEVPKRTQPLPFYTAAVPPRTPFAGVSRLGLQDYTAYTTNPADAPYNPTEIAQLQQLRQSGVDVIRYGTSLWAYVPTPIYSPEVNPAVVLTPDAARLAQLSSLGFTVNLELGMEDARRYGSGVFGNYPVDGTATSLRYATAVARVVNQYTSCPYNIRYFELGNEVDHTWGTDNGAGIAPPTSVADYHNSAQNYVQALATFAVAVKTAAPDAVVVNGGLTYDGRDQLWLPEALQAGLGNYIDVLAFHFYQAAYYAGYKTLSLKTIDVLRTLHTPGPGYSYPPFNGALWCNESGLTSEQEDFVSATTATPSSVPSPVFTSRTPVTDRTVQAGQIVRMNVGGAAANLVGQVWFTRADTYQVGIVPTSLAQGTPVTGLPQYTVFGHSGLTTRDDIAKPGLTAMQVLGQQHLGTWPLAHPSGYPDGVNFNTSIEGYTFRNPLNQRFTSVIWDSEDKHTDADGGHNTYTVNKVVNLGAVVNMFGTPVAVAATLTPNVDPLYLQWKTSFTDVDADYVFYPFIDVDADYVFYPFIDHLVQRGVMTGYSDYTFRPSNPVTRGQACKIIVLAANLPINTAGGPHFTDVPPNNVFYPFVETAYNRSIISGYSDGTFQPSNTATRGQLCKILVLAEGWQLYTTGGPHFTDVPTSYVFYPFVETAYYHGIISGYNDGTFRPNNTATRGQISKMTDLAVGLLATPTVTATPTWVTPGTMCATATTVTSRPQLPLAVPTNGPGSATTPTATLPGPQPSQPPVLPQAVPSQPAPLP